MVNPLARLDRSWPQVCPQFDILWPTLTVEEHLRTYAAFKGMPPQGWLNSSSASQLLPLLGDSFTCTVTSSSAPGSLVLYYNALCSSDNRAGPRVGASSAYILTAQS